MARSDLRSFMCIVQLLATAGCRKPAPAVEAVDAAVPANDAAAPLASSTPPARDPQVRARYRQALAEGQRAAAKKDWPRAVAAFDEALRLAPDAQAYGERGYAKLRSGDLAGAEADLEAGRNLGGSQTVAAQLAYNLGLVREKQGRTEEARAAFAASQSLRPAAGAAKLTGTATCSAELSRGSGEYDLGKPASWDEARALVGRADVDGPAKHVTCMQSTSDDPSADTSDDCAGAPPWIVSRDYQWYRHWEYVLYPRVGTKQIFVVDLGLAGGWPAHCTGTSSSTAEQHDFVGHLAHTYDGTQSIVVENPQSAADPTCEDGSQTLTDVFYDLRSGKTLLHVVRLMAPGAPRPLAALTFEGHVVKVEGDGCHVAIDLDAAP